MIQSPACIYNHFDLFFKLSFVVSYLRFLRITKPNRCLGSIITIVLLSCFEHKGDGEMEGLREQASLGPTCLAYLPHIQEATNYCYQPGPGSQESISWQFDPHLEDWTVNWSSMVALNGVWCMLLCIKNVKYTINFINKKNSKTNMKIKKLISNQIINRVTHDTNFLTINL